MNVRLFAAAVLMLGAVSSRAEQNAIVFDLGSDVPKAAAKPAPTPPRAFGMRSASHTSSVLPLLTGPRRRFVGRLGYVVYTNSRVYDSPYRRRIYNVLQPNQWVVLTGYNSQWYGVLMADGRTGWVPRQCVQVVDYDIAIDGRVPTPMPGVTGLDAIPLLRTAMGFMGIPYKWGGTSWNGIDCSAFVRAVFRTHGVELPRVARDQAKVGTPVPIPSLQPGDRLYFACHHSYIDHTGIYMGRGYFIHSSGGRGVGISLLTSSPYWRGLVEARRL